MPRKIQFAGALLFFVTGILLLIASISAPTVPNIALLRIDIYRSSLFADYSSITFGVTGYCELSKSAPAYCVGQTGYFPDNTGIGYNVAEPYNAPALIAVPYVVPVACALSFISVLMTLGASPLWSLFSAGLAWIATIVGMAIALSVFEAIKDGINDGGSGNVAYYGAAMWCLVVGFIIQFFSVALVGVAFFTAKQKSGLIRSGWTM